MEFWRRNREQDLEEELRAHLEMAAGEQMRRGATIEAAQHAARREFGNVELVKETVRDVWGSRWADDFLADVRYGVRMLRKNAGFTLVAVWTLALGIGIGANTALFSVVNGVLFNPLPYPHPEQLVWLGESKPNFATGSISFPNFRDWQKYNRAFSAMGASRPFSYSLTGMGEAEVLSGRLITADFFRVLGVRPVLGRPFAPGEDAIGAPPIAMISGSFWKRKFASAPEALG